jgi:hypothetical protein
MNLLPEVDLSSERRVRICRPAFQDMQLLLARQAGRACLRRNAMKLRFWKREDQSLADLDLQKLDEEFFVATLEEGYGFAEGFNIVFCEETNPEPDGTVWILSVMRTDERFSASAMEILRARCAIMRERAGIDRWWQG